MKIHGICLVRDEGDIIESSLSAALAWCDHIYVYDNGSADDTWEKVQTLARKESQIVPFKKHLGAFSDSLRSDVFNYFRTGAEDGDWWCRLDADEFYIDAPKTFLAKLKARYHVVWGIQIQYYFTDKDFENFRREPSRYLDGYQVVGALRYYRADASEERFVRHRKRLVWDGTSWPKHMGIAAPQRIRVRHLKYRFPQQIEGRLAIRRQARSSGYQGFGYAEVNSWSDKIVSANSLHCDQQDGTYVIDEASLPRHIEAKWRRAFKTIMHGTGIWA